MSRYPSQPLEEKLEWMRERMRAKAESPKPVHRALSPAKYRRQRQRAETVTHLTMFRVSEVAETLGVSPQTVRRMFQGRPGVVEIGETKTTKDRRRKSILLISLRAIEEWVEEHRSVSPFSERLK